MNNFDYEGAKKAGYSDDEIKSFIDEERSNSYKPTNFNNENEGFWETAKKNISNNFSNFVSNFSNPGLKPEKNEAEKVDQRLLKKVPGFDVQGAIQSGYSSDEINEFLEENAPKRSALEKGARLATQFGTSLASATPSGMVYEAAVAPLSSKEAQTVGYRENLSNDIERLKQQRDSIGLDEQDKSLLKNLEEQMQDVSKSEEFIQTAPDLTFRGIVEGITGADLHPEGIAEKAASWMGWLKDPKKGIQNLKNIGTDKATLIKSLIPGTKTLSGIGAGTALEMAEQGNFGLTGTIAAAIAGDLIGRAPKGALYVAKNPKKAAAEALNLLTRNNSKQSWTKQVIEDAKEAGIQLDAGTITNSNFVRMAQAKAAQSALVGNSLDEFKKNLSEQFINQYKEIADLVGELTFETNHQAAEAIQNALRVEEQKFPFFKEFDRKGRSLEGRVAVQERPLYQQELLQQISPTEFASDYQAGLNIKTAAEDIKAPIQEDFRNRWSDFGQRIQFIEAPQAQLAAELRTFIEENRGSLLLGEATAESKVIRAAESLLERLVQGGSLVGISVEDLIKTKRTLADIANWEIGTSNYASKFKEITGRLDSAIENTFLDRGATELLEEFRELNAEYSGFKDTFENKNVERLFKPKDENYNSLYDSFISDPDKLRALEDMMYFSPRGEEIVNQVKRDYARKVTSKPDLSERDLRNLSQVLGEEYQPAIENFARQRQYDLDHPRPVAAQGQRFGTQVESPQTTSPANLQGKKIKESDIHARKKMYETLSGKSSDQIMQQMSTVDGIKKLRKVLETTAEGKDLFKKLSRMKLEEVIGNKMKSDLNETIKLGTFPGTVKNSKTKEIIKELVGEKSYDKLRLLQKNADVLQQSLYKFHNSSRSASSIADVAAISSGMVGIISGNPYLMAKTLGSAVLLRTAANLLSDPVFLKYLEEAVLSKTDKRFMTFLKKMEIPYRTALMESMESTGNP